MEPFLVYLQKKLPKPLMVGEVYFLICKCSLSHGVKTSRSRNLSYRMGLKPHAREIGRGYATCLTINVLQVA